MRRLSQIWLINGKPISHPNYPPGTSKIHCSYTVSPMQSLLHFQWFNNFITSNSWTWETEGVCASDVGVGISLPLLNSFRKPWKKTPLCCCLLFSRGCCFSWIQIPLCLGTDRERERGGGGCNFHVFQGFYRCLKQKLMRHFFTWKELALCPSDFNNHEEIPTYASLAQTLSNG